MLGLIGGLSPVVVFSTSVVAPNGLEILAALGFWVGLAGLAFDSRSRHVHFSLSLIAGVILISIRSLGPLWCLLIFLCALVAFAPLWPTLRAMLRRSEGLVAAVVAAVSGAASLAWILSQRSLEIGLVENDRPVSIAERAAQSFGAVPLWAFQAVAAYPSRSNPAPGVVYAAYFFFLIALLAIGLVLASRRARLGMGLTVALSFLIPVLITAWTLDSFGVAWQGRYGMPLLIGVPVVAGICLSRLDGSLNRGLAGLGLVAWGVAQSAGPYGVMQDEIRNSPLAGTPEWMLETSPAVVALVAGIGSLLVVCSMVRNRGAEI